MQIGQMRHQPAIRWGGKACLKFIFALFGQFHHVSKVLDWGGNLVRFVDANKWLSRDSAAVSRFVICQDC